MEKPDSFGPLTPLLSKYFIIHEKQIDLERERERKKQKQKKILEQQIRTKKRKHRGR